MWLVTSIRRSDRPVLVGRRMQNFIVVPER